MTSAPAPGVPALLLFPLQGRRVLLRPFEETDVQAAHTVYGDAEVMRYVGAGVPVTADESARMLDHHRRHQSEHGFAFWAVVDRRTGALLGDAGLEVTEHGMELGYTLARTAWGRGLATEAARLCVEAAFGPLALPRLVALADARNPASARVLEKLGFVRGAEVPAFGRPHHVFELVAPRAGHTERPPS